jgi:bile acid:Na+ symporter, BASS family
LRYKNQTRALAAIDAGKGDTELKDIIMAAIKIIIPLSVALVMFTQGLGINPAQVLKFFKERPGRMLKAIVACLVLVPAAAVAIILLLKPSPGVAIGLAIMVACPPAPLMLQTATKVGKGSAPFTASIHLTFAALAIVTVPAVLDVISQPLGFHADVALGSLAWTLARTILIPVSLGLILRGLVPDLADRILPIVSRAGSIGLLIALLVVLVVLGPTLIRMGPWSYLVIAAVCIAALLIGHLLGPDDPHERTSLAVDTAARHPGLAFSIAAMNFTPAKALPVMGPCILTFILIAFVYLLLRGKRATSIAPVGSVS